MSQTNPATHPTILTVCRRPTRLLTVKEAAARLGTTERFPRRLIAERRIRYVKLGGHHVRIPEVALTEFIAAARQCQRDDTPLRPGCRRSGR